MGIHLQVAITDRLKSTDNSEILVRILMLCPGNKNLMGWLSMHGIK